MRGAKVGGRALNALITRWDVAFWHVLNPSQKQAPMVAQAPAPRIAHILAGNVGVGKHADDHVGGFQALVDGVYIQPAPCVQTVTQGGGKFPFFAVVTNKYFDVSSPVHS